ncbi:DUF3440 domain-containing protein [Streptomyces sp. NPDC056347]|uniref:DUF3440 domain-containing protein n=1 Tax=Streptomyces sp. NPDC056347 TaxID=3345790 RepID=UPI0035DDBF47
MKKSKAIDVWEATRRRLGVVFRDFDNIVVAFSGGKDSGVMLNATLAYMREHGITKKITVVHFDYEAQYQATTDYVTEVMTSNPDLIDPVWICLPMAVISEVSMYQSHWKPWDPELQDIWVRPLPDASGVIHTGNVPEGFPAYDGVWDYTFQEQVSRWLHRRAGAERTAVLVGIRTQESHHRQAAIHREDKHAMWQSYRWTTKLSNGVYNAYPIHDWNVEDIWVANGDHQWSYNELYDLFHLAGVPLNDMRVASPFRGEGQESLKLYREIEPDTWGRLVGRVNGANFTAIYGGTRAMGTGKVRLPEGHTWKSYAVFLWKTLPEERREEMFPKIRTTMRYWTVTGGALTAGTVANLRENPPEDAEVEFLGAPTDNRKRKTPMEIVRFSRYPDDLSGRGPVAEVPDWRRMAVCFLKNDWQLKGMGFGQTAIRHTQRVKALEKLKETL